MSFFIHTLGILQEEALARKYFYNGYLWDFFFEEQLELPVHSKTKNYFLIDNHFKTSYGPATSECSSCRWLGKVQKNIKF